MVYSSHWKRINTSVLFAKDMDRESVEAAFSTDPPPMGLPGGGDFYGGLPS